MEEWKKKLAKEFECKKRLLSCHEEPANQELRKDVPGCPMKHQETSQGLEGEEVRRALKKF